MERYTMLFDWKKNQYCENKYITQKNLQTQCAITIKLPMTFFMELKQKLCNLYGNTKDSK